MKDIFRPGDQKRHRFIVLEQDTAQFNGHVVHAVCSTFTLAREMEWAGRLFVLDMCDPGEEGIGTSLHIDHISPARVGDTVEVIATYKSFVNTELVCQITVNVGKRTVAKGYTGQKILSKEKIKHIIDKDK